MGGIAGSGISLGSLFVTIAAQVDDALKDIQAFGDQTAKVIKDQEKQWEGLAKVGDQFSKLGTQLSLGVTLPIAGIGAAALKLSGDFEAAMNKITAVSGTTGGELELLRRQAMQLGADTKFSAQEAAEGMGELAAAGLNTTQVMQAMPGVLDLAAAGQLSVARAAEITTDTLGQFGLAASEAGHIADVLAKAAAASSVSVEQVANALKYAGPPAELAGVSMEQAATAIALLGNAGIKGEQAGTSLRGVIESLVHPSKAAAEALAALGVDAEDSAGKMKPLDVLFGELKKSGIQAGDMFTIFGSNAASAASVLTKDAGPAWALMTAEIAKSEGAAKSMADALMKGLTGQLEQFKGSVETAGIALGNSLKPAMESVLSIGTKLVNWLTQAFEWFEKLPDPVKNGVLALVAFAAAIGPILLGVGSLITIMTTLGPALALMAGGLGLSTVAMFGWAAAIAVALGALVALGTWIYQNWDAITVDFLTDMIKISESIASVYEKLPFMGKALENVRANIKSWTADVDAANKRMRDNAAAALEMEHEQEKLERRLQSSKDEAKKGAAQVDALTAEIKSGAAAADAAAKSNEKLGKSTKGMTEAQYNAKAAYEASQKALKAHTDAAIRMKEAVDKQTEAAKKSMKAFDDLEPPIDAVTGSLRKALGPLDEVQSALRGMPVYASESAKMLDALGGSLNQVGDSTTKAWDALKQYGVGSTSTYEQVARDAKTAYETVLASGRSTQYEIDQMRIKYLEAEHQAATSRGQIWAEADAKELAGLKDKYEKLTTTSKTAWSDLSNQVSTIVTNFAQDISKSLWEGDLSWGEKGKALLKSLGEAVTSAFVEPATKAIAKFISGAISDLLSGKGLGGVLDTLKDIGKTSKKVFTETPISGAVPGGSTPPTTAPGGGAPPVANSLTGWISAISGAVTAISSVIGNFQMAGMNKSLDLIVNHTLRIYNDLAGFKLDSWDRWAQFQLIKDDIINRLNSLVDSANLARLQLNDMIGADNRHEELFNRMVTATEQIALSSNRDINITVTGSDPATNASYLATRLRSQGAFA